MKKKLSLLITLVILNTSNILAQQNNCFCQKYSKSVVLNAGNISQNPSIATFNKTSKTEVCKDLDIFVTYTFIYWKPYESGLRLGVWADDITLVSNLTRYEYVDPKSEFKPGFKLGLGYNLNYDSWTLFLEYTRFHPQINNVFTRPSWGQRFLSNWFIGNKFGDINVPNFLTIKWKINYDISDLELSRWEYKKTKLLFNPFVGIKAGFLDQTFITGLIDDTKNIEVFAKYNSYLIGPRVGIYGKYLLEKNFSILAKIAASLSYQKAYDQKSETKDLNNPSLSSVTIRAKDTHDLLAIVEMFLGFNWGTYFIKNKYHFDIFAGYETQFLSNQNFLTALTTRSSNFFVTMNNTDRSDLNFQGMTLIARFDF